MVVETVVETISQSPFMGPMNSATTSAMTAPARLETEDGTAQRATDTKSGTSGEIDCCFADMRIEMDGTSADRVSQYALAPSSSLAGAAGAASFNDETDATSQQQQPQHHPQHHPQHIDASQAIAVEQGEAITRCNGNASHRRQGQYSSTAQVQAQTETRRRQRELHRNCPESSQCRRSPQCTDDDHCCGGYQKTPAWAETLITACRIRGRSSHRLCCLHFTQQNRSHHQQKHQSTQVHDLRQQPTCQCKPQQQQQQHLQDYHASLIEDHLTCTSIVAGTTKSALKQCADNRSNRSSKINSDTKTKKITIMRLAMPLRSVFLLALFFICTDTTLISARQLDSELPLSTSSSSKATARATKSTSAVEYRSSRLRATTLRRAMLGTDDARAVAVTSARKATETNSTSASSSSNTTMAPTQAPVLPKTPANITVAPTLEPTQFNATYRDNKRTTPNATDPDIDSDEDDDNGNNTGIEVTTEAPTDRVFEVVTFEPTTSPTQAPSFAPTISQSPSSTPTQEPSVVPSQSLMPSQRPSVSHQPTHSMSPSSLPSPQPSVFPTGYPSATPSVAPTDIPSTQPTHIPTALPSATPTLAPSSQPSSAPTLTLITVVEPRIFLTLDGLFAGIDTAEEIALFEQLFNQLIKEYYDNLAREVPQLVPVAIVHVDTLLKQKRFLPKVQPRSSAVKRAPTSSSNDGDRRLQLQHEAELLPLERGTERVLQFGGVNDTNTTDDGQNSTNTSSPTAPPTLIPSALPTTSQPTSNPTQIPTGLPTSLPTSMPSIQPTSAPTVTPTALPTATPTTLPTALPTNQPTAQPTVEPTKEIDKSVWLQLEYQQTIVYSVLPDLDGVPNMQWTPEELFTFPILKNEQEMLIRLTQLFGRGEFVRLVDFQVEHAQPPPSPVGTTAPNTTPTAAPTATEVQQPTVLNPNTDNDNPGSGSSRMSPTLVAIISSAIVIVTLFFVAGFLFYKLKKDERRLGAYDPDDNLMVQQDETMEFDNTSAFHNPHFRPDRGQREVADDAEPPNGRDKPANGNNTRWKNTIFSSSTAQVHNGAFPRQEHTAKSTPKRSTHLQTVDAVDSAHHHSYANDIHSRTMSAVASDITGISDKASFDDDAAGSACGPSSTSLASPNGGTPPNSRDFNLHMYPKNDASPRNRLPPLSPVAPPSSSVSPVHIPENFDNELSSYRFNRSPPSSMRNTPQRTMSPPTELNYETEEDGFSVPDDATDPSLSGFNLKIQHLE